MRHDADINNLLLILVYVGSRLVLRVSIIIALLYQMRRFVIAVENVSRRRRRKFVTRRHVSRICYRSVTNDSRRRRRGLPRVNAINLFHFHRRDKITNWAQVISYAWSLSMSGHSPSVIGLSSRVDC